MKRFTAFPWGRTACVVGSVGSSVTMGEEPVAGALALMGFLFTGAALHAIAAFRPRENHSPSEPN